VLINYVQANAVRIIPAYRQAGIINYWLFFTTSKS